MEPRKLALLTLVVTIAGFGVIIGFQAFIVTQLSNQQSSGFTLSSDLLPTTDTNIAISGSTTCYPTITDAANIFMVYNFEYNVRVSGGGSGQGASDVINGIVDIGMMSRNPKTSEHASLLSTYGAYHDVQFALDGVSIICHKSSVGANIANLTLDELYDIYAGKIDQWDDLSGWTGPSGDYPIVPHTRESGSGTRGTFEELVYYNSTGTELGDDSSYQTNVGSYATSDGNPAMAEDVGSTSNAIGYVGLAFVDDSTHKLIPISAWNSSSDNWGSPITPSETTIRSGDYEISRFLHLIVPGLIMPAKSQNFVNFILGDQGQDIVENTGYITLEGAGGDITVTA